MRSLFDLAVLRPVLALSVNLLLVAIGLGAAFTLPVREYPAVDPPTVSVRTLYPGAASEVVEREVTRVIEDGLSGVSGIRLVRSISRDESSLVILEFTASTDLDAAAADVRERVGSVARDLPAGIDPPVVEKANADDFAAIFLVLRSPGLPVAELTDLAERRLVDAIGIVPGVASVEVYGGRRYAMRIWLDPAALAARGLTPADVAARLRAENVELPAGRLETARQEIGLRAVTRLRGVEDFAALILRDGDGVGAGRVRLGDVARVEVGVESYRSAFLAGGQPAIALGVLRRSDANALEVSRAVGEAVARLRPGLPAGVSLEVSADDAVFIRATLENVGRTLVETVLVVIAVIFLFLGSARATLLPAATIPASIIPAAAVAAALGYSVNVLSILAVILAIGLCVDDAVVVMENIRRRQQAGEPLLLAAVRATRQVGFAVFATTATLLAVILPLAFLPGNVGALFEEFAVVLAATVAFSTIAAVTLGPMLSARLFRGDAGEGRVARISARAQDWLAGRYRAALRPVLAAPWLALAAGAAFAAAGAGAYLALPQELAPDEDRGQVTIVAEGPEGAAFPETLEQVRRIEEILAPLSGPDGPVAQVLSIVAPGRGGAVQPNTAFLILRLSEWEAREVTQQALVEDLRRELAALPGIRAFAVNPPKLGQRRSGRQFRVAVAATDREAARAWAAELARAAGGIEGLVGLDVGDKPTRPQLLVEVDRDRAAELGLDAAIIGQTLNILFGAPEVTRWLDRGEEYDVLLSARAEDREAPADLGAVRLRARGGELVALSGIVRLTEVGSVRELVRVDRLAAVELGASLVPGTSLGQVVADTEDAAAERLPPEARLRWLGEAADLAETGGAVALILGLVLVLTFLVLAAQFESFVHPVTVLATAPLAIAGGLLTLLAFGLTLNVYSQIGMVLLVGLVAKNGILLVEFANQLRDEGLAPRAAVEEAAALRLRPILMTSVATVLGAVPLAVATGAGAESRQAIGLVVAGGVTLGTALTLFVVPAAWLLAARVTGAPGAVGAEFRRLERDHPDEARMPAE